MLIMWDMEGEAGNFGMKLVKSATEDSLVTSSSPDESLGKSCIVRDKYIIHVIIKSDIIYSMGERCPGYKVFRSFQPIH